LWGDRPLSEATDLGSSEIGNEDSSCSATVSNSIVQGGYPSGTNIIDSDPLFVDAICGNLHLSAGSPAIDAGNGCATNVTLTDLEGNGRWDIASVANAVNGLDIGAFEYQGTASTDALISSFFCL